MPATSVRTMSREDLQQLQQELLDDVRLTYDELRARAIVYTLQADQRAAYETIRSIDYMLGR
jgi:hypothetical protein